MINYDELAELHRWMTDHLVLEVEVNGVRMRLAESAIEVDQPTDDDGEDDERPAPPVTHDGLRAAAVAVRKSPDA